MTKLDHTDLSMRQQCNLLDIHRSGIYYKPKPKQDEFELTNKIHELWLKRPFYGYRRITQVLKRDGHSINYKRVIRLMRKMGLQAIYPKKRLSVGNKEHQTYPYLLRGLDIVKPNQVWASDITYIKLSRGFVYLVCLIDLYSRYIVSWELANCLQADFCISMLQRALLISSPEIVNTDQGVQFTSQDWTSLLKQNGVKISMDGVGRCIDNIYIERFWRTIKYEDATLMVYETMNEAHTGIKQYIEFYNNQRLHSSLGYKTPAEVYRNHEQKKHTLCLPKGGCQQVEVMSLKF